MAFDGVDSVRALTQAYAKNPKDAAVVFKLGEKFRMRAMADKATEKFREVLALDPEGKAGAYKPDYMKTAVPYKEWAEYQIAYAPLTGKRDPAPMREFIKAHPAGEMLRQAYSSLEIFYVRTSPKEEAFAFYEEYAARFPSDTMVLCYWLQRIMTEKGPYDKGRPIVERIRGLTENSPEPFLTALVAQFYVDSGDKAKAEEAFGPAFADSLLSSAAFGLLDYADFWVKQGLHQDSARAMAETAVKILGQNPYILQTAADVFLSMGDQAKALDLFGPAFARSRWDQPGELRSYVWFWTQKGINLENALAACKRALELRPRAYYHWQAMADVLLKMKDYGEAVKAAEKAVEFASPAAKPAMQKNLEKVRAAAAEKK
jgi:tetratricopeptide (TPR) repeat protein